MPRDAFLAAFNVPGRVAVTVESLLGAADAERFGLASDRFWVWEWAGGEIEHHALASCATIEAANAAADEYAEISESIGGCIVAVRHLTPEPA